MVVLRAGRTQPDVDISHCASWDLFFWGTELTAEPVSSKFLMVLSPLLLLDIPIVLSLTPSFCEDLMSDLTV